MLSDLKKNRLNLIFESENPFLKNSKLSRRLGNAKKNPTKALCLKKQMVYRLFFGQHCIWDKFETKTG